MNPDPWASFDATLVATAVGSCVGALVGVLGVWLVARAERARLYSESLDRAVAEIVVAIGARSDALLDRADAADQIMNAVSGPSIEEREAEVEELGEVRTGRLASAVQVFALTTKKRRDREVSSAFKAAVETATSRGGRSEAQSLLASSDALVAWRSKVRSRRQAVEDLNTQALGH